MASTLPGPARDFVRTLTEAVDAAVSGDDAEAYDSAIARLATQPAGGRVLADVLRSLLEDTHPDGLNSDDITLVIGPCYRAAAAWLPPERVDVPACWPSWPARSPSRRPHSPSMRERPAKNSPDAASRTEAEPATAVQDESAHIPGSADDPRDPMSVATVRSPSVGRW